MTSNSLANTYPEIAKQWHLHKNGEITPNDVSRVTTKYIGGSVKKVMNGVQVLLAELEEAMTVPIVAVKSLHRRHAYKQEILYSQKNGIMTKTDHLHHLMLP